MINISKGIVITQPQYTCLSSLSDVRPPVALCNLGEDLLPVRPTVRVVPIHPVPSSTTLSRCTLVRLPVRIALGTQDLGASVHLRTSDLHPYRSDFDLDLPWDAGLDVCCGSLGRLNGERLEVRAHRRDAIKVLVDNVKRPEFGEEGVEVEPFLAGLGDRALVWVVRRGVSAEDSSLSG